MLRVLQVIPRLDGGGVERTTLDVARAIIAHGGQAHIAVEDGRLIADAEVMGAHIHRLPLASKNPLTVRANIARLKSLIRQHDIQIVHARSRAPAWSALKAARKTKTSFVTTYAGIHKARSPLKRWYNSVMAKGDVVITNSNFTRDHVMAEHGTPRERLVTIYRGVDVTAFDAASTDPADIARLRKALALPSHDRRPIVVLPARLSPWKGQDVALKAIAHLHATTPHRVLLVLVGDDTGKAKGRKPTRKAQLEALAAQLGIEASVRFAGHVRDMPAVYALADIVLAPSTEPEAFGRTAVEAQAMARPVIVSDHGGACETVEHETTGWRVPPGDAQALAGAIATALNMTPTQRLALGDRAAKRVRDLFALSGMQAATLSVYRSLL